MVLYHNEKNNFSIYIFHKNTIDYFISKLDSNKYIISKNNGSFYIIIRCNRNKVITDEIGNLISVDDDSANGVFTSFRGYFLVSNDEPITNPNSADYDVVFGGGTDRTGKNRFKIPQFVEYSLYNKWVWQHYKFDFGEIYSVAQLNSVRSPGLGGGQEWPYNQTNILYFGNANIGATNNSRDIRPNFNSDNGGKYKNFYNHIKCILCQDEGTVNLAMKNQWINFSIFFTNFKYNTSNFPYVDFYIVPQLRLKDDVLDIGGGQKNSKWIANGTYLKTNFVKINKEDLINTFYEYKIDNIIQLGFRIPKAKLNGEYLRENNQGVAIMNQDLGDAIGEYYFLKGANDNDVIKYLIDSNII
jgi:hypothetical protein